MAQEKQYTREEVAALTARTVFVIDNVVYDVTPFLDEHPGGHEVLAHAAGGDASEEFHDVGHSLDARDLMRRFAVGELAAEERREVRARAPAWEADAAAAAAAASREPGLLSSWTLPLVLGLLVTVLYSYLFT